MPQQDRLQNAMLPNAIGQLLQLDSVERLAIVLRIRLNVMDRHHRELLGVSPRCRRFSLPRRPRSGLLRWLLLAHCRLRRLRPLCDRAATKQPRDRLQARLIMQRRNSACLPAKPDRKRFHLTKHIAKRCHHAVVWNGLHQLPDLIRRETGLSILGQYDKILPRHHHRRHQCQGIIHRREVRRKLHQGNVDDLPHVVRAHEILGNARVALDPFQIDMRQSVQL